MFCWLMLYAILLSFLKKSRKVSDLARAHGPRIPFEARKGGKVFFVLASNCRGGGVVNRCWKNENTQSIYLNLGAQQGFDFRINPCDDNLPNEILMRWPSEPLRGWEQIASESGGDTVAGGRCTATGDREIETDDTA